MNSQVIAQRPASLSAGGLLRVLGQKQKAGFGNLKFPNPASFSAKLTHKI